MLAWLSYKIRQCDVFAVPVSLTMRGKSSFTSVFGGLVSILVVSAVLGISG